MLLDRFRMPDRVAIVTGAGRGIGRGIALGLAELGARVVCAARTQAQIDATVADIAAAGQGAGVAIACDVTDAAQRQALVAKAVEAYGRVDILVNNAGGTQPLVALQTEPDFFDQALHFNCTAAFALSRLVAKSMLAGDGGSIVNISSAMSHLSDSGFVAYGTAKAALNHMTRLLAYEWAPKIRVNALAVGAVKTSALTPFLAMGDLEAQMVALTPMGRLGETEDIAMAAAFLASDASSWISGKVIEVDGGAVQSTWPLKIPGY